MLFNSLDFAIFLPLVLLIYWLFKNKYEIQNFILLIASYIFYGWWDWRFLGLIFLSTLLDYSLGRMIYSENSKRRKRLYLFLSILMNLGLLGYFKYYNFFIESFENAFSFLGYKLGLGSLDIILPVGISFYTFQTLSYTIDIYRSNLKPTKNFLTFGTFVSFFPQLVAGPIERAVNLLPQFQKKRSFKYREGVEGLRQILWGLFKKVVIADNCAEYVNIVFANSEAYAGSTLLLGAILFAFQIYGDFSGYSDIAIGTARLFGIKLMQNFAFPYFSRDIAEFWRRWHISLSTWFRDYLYIPLGGSSGAISNRLRNILIIFFVSGLWHGANWTFIFWGGLHALFYIPLVIRGRNRSHLDIIGQSARPKIWELFKMALTFIMVVFAWIFFRSVSIEQAIIYISKIFSSSLFRMPELNTLMSTKLLIILIFFMLLSEWFGRRGKFPLEAFEVKCPVFIRWSYYIFLFFCLGMYMHTEESAFIYFQF